MSDTFKIILSLSISGTILSLIILALKPLIRHKLPKSFQYYIWVVVLLRLLLPFSFEESIINKMFDKSAVYTNTQTINNNENNTYNQNLAFELKMQKTQTPAVYVSNYKSETSKIDYKTIVKNNIFYIYLLGLMIVIILNLKSYLKFKKYVLLNNKPAEVNEYKLPNTLIKNKKVKLYRNSYISTPMLIGFFNPLIVIPNVYYSEAELKNILLHEIAHLERFDIIIKWLTLFTTAIHYFNPMMLLIKKEINKACELACDEYVIKNLSDTEKQSYGETLISVVSEVRYPSSIISANMCEEKETLKERLISIMKYSKRTKLITLLSILFIAFIVLGAVLLGAKTKEINIKPPDIYVNAEGSKTKLAQIGTYSWKIKNKSIQADSLHPTDFEYSDDNIISLDAGDIITLTTQKTKTDKKYEFTLESIEIYKNKNKIEYSLPKPFIQNGLLYISSPQDAGEYIYSIFLNYKDKGKVNYSFVVRVNIPNYNLEEIQKHKTPYLGDNSKVSSLVNCLPLPSKKYIQKYISMDTTKKPLTLTVYYEKKEGANGQSLNNSFYTIIEKNALVLFAMIKNLDEVKFAFRDTPSTGSLDTSKYNMIFPYTRKDIENTYENTTSMYDNIEVLKNAIYSSGNNYKKYVYLNLPEFTDKEVSSARAVVEKYFKAIHDKNDKEILETLHEKRKSKNMVLYGNETRTLLSISYDPQDYIRKSYRPNDPDFSPEKIIVFKVSFKVEYPKGKSGPWEEGIYDNWNMILIRKDINSPWYIYDQGY
ncbi:MAG: DUF4829 domain-containing protein [Caloramator sp.]|nr:DUF4829 domain-containing protein [Caloramator sp.]